MGFINPSEQPVEPAEFLQLPLRERVRILAQHWVDDGFGTPRVLHVVYVLKMLGKFLMRVHQVVPDDHPKIFGSFTGSDKAALDQAANDCISLRDYS